MKKIKLRVNNPFGRSIVFNSYTIGVDFSTVVDKSTFLLLMYSPQGSYIILEEDLEIKEEKQKDEEKIEEVTEQKVSKKRNKEKKEEIVVPPKEEEEIIKGEQHDNTEVTE